MYKRLFPKGSFYRGRQNTPCFIIPVSEYVSADKEELRVDLAWSIHST
jgi:hypothetical protein